MGLADGRGTVAQNAVSELDPTEHALERATEHRIRIEELNELLLGRFVVARNRKNRAASHVLIGRTLQGRCLVVPMVATDQFGRWRALSVWPCKPSEAVKLRRLKEESMSDDKYRLTAEEERELMDPETWDWEAAESFSGVPDPRIGFRVALGRAHLAALDAAAAREGVNPAVLIQRFVEERLATETEATAPIVAGLAESA
jgi:hypothetical protein